MRSPTLLVKKSCMLTGRPSSALNAAILPIVMRAALFLSFWRAAWGQFAFAMAVSFATLPLRSRPPGRR